MKGEKQKPSWPPLGAPCIAGIFLLLISTAGADTENEDSKPDQTDDQIDLCIQHPEKNKAAEQVQAVLHTFSCKTARWIDHLFGDTHDFNEDQVSGIMSAGFRWSEFDDLEPKTRFRLKSDLPNVDSRVNAFLGRVDEEAYIRETKPLEDSAYRQGFEDEEASWLLGFGYNPNSKRRQGFDYSLGVRLRSTPDPYAKIRYRYNRTLATDSDLRFRQTLFWRLDDGFGTTSYLDMANELGVRKVLRWETIGTVSEDTEGLNWWTGTTLYQHLGGKQGIAFLAFVRGETDEPVSLQEYGFRVTWRRPLGREWLFMELGPSVTWPRERLDQSRDISLGFGFLFEIHFGQKKQD